MTPFTQALRTAMGKQQVKDVADAARIGRSTLSAARNSDKVPLLANVARLADVLMAPGLLELAVAMRTGTCPICGASFVDNSFHVARVYCGVACRRVAQARQQRPLNERRNAITTRVAVNRLKAMQAAVDAHCSDCTLGEGICRDDGCHLRPVSPLPFVPLHKAGRRVA